MVQIFFTIIAFLIALTVHEAAHAVVATRLGDPTAKLMGRLTLNPIPHIDPIGTILLPAILILSGSPIVFGWAKPVIFDPFNLQNPRRDSALISIAGPVSNVVLAIALSLTLRFIGNVDYVSLFLVQIIIINVVLALFNLIPIHPLDGFKVVAGILPEHLADEWEVLEPYGMYLLLFSILPIFNGRSLVNLVVGIPLDFLLTLLLG